MVGVAHRDVLAPGSLGDASASLFPVTPAVDPGADRTHSWPGGSPIRHAPTRWSSTRTRATASTSTLGSTMVLGQTQGPRPGPAAVRARDRRRAVPAEADAWSASPSRCRATRAGPRRAASTPSTARTCPQLVNLFVDLRGGAQRDPGLHRARRAHPRAPGERRGHRRPLRHSQGEERHRPRARRPAAVRARRAPRRRACSSGQALVRTVSASAADLPTWRAIGADRRLAIARPGRSRASSPWSVAALTTRRRRRRAVVALPARAPPATSTSHVGTHADWFVLGLGVVAAVAFVAPRGRGAARRGGGINRRVPCDARPSLHRSRASRR